MYGMSEFRRESGDERFMSALSLVSLANKKSTEDIIDSDSWNCEVNIKNNYENDRNDVPQTHLRSGLHRPKGDVIEESELDISCIHTIWSLSKDLGCSGLRMVCLHVLLVPLLTPHRRRSFPNATTLF